MDQSESSIPETNVILYYIHWGAKSLCQTLIWHHNLTIPMQINHEAPAGKPWLIKFVQRAQSNHKIWDARKAALMQSIINVHINATQQTRLPNQSNEPPLPPHLLYERPGVKSRQRGLLSRFNDHRVPAGQSWRDLPHEHQQREVPLQIHKTIKQIMQEIADNGLLDY